MKSFDERLSQTYSYLALRKAVGWIGILLPVVLALGSVIFFGEKSLRENISLYYYSGMRDVFVGALCAIALFLFFYKGYDRWDNISAHLAALFALGIAFFPTVPEGKYNAAATIHFISAAVFFIILAGMSFFLFTRSKPDPTKRKIIRNKIYIGCGLVMIVCLAAILIFYIFFNAKRPDSRLVFWSETIALIAFGISWLTKGGTLYPDIKKRLAGKTRTVKNREKPEGT